MSRRRSVSLRLFLALAAFGVASTSTGATARPRAAPAAAQSAICSTVVTGSRSPTTRVRRSGRASSSA